jgi:flagellin
MSSILTNNSAMVALQTLKGINKNMGQIQNEISTGKSVATAKDNAAVWAISKVMESDVQGFKGISDSLALGSSTISVARQASETVTKLLTDIKGKIVAAQEGNVDREKIQTDISALREQIKSVTGAAQFNGLNMVSGTDDVSILSSLDRSGNGNVSASNITVSRQDLTASAGKIGTTTATAAAYGTSTLPDGATAATTTTPAAGKNAVVTLADAATVGENFSMNINGKAISFNSVSGAENATALGDYFAGAINALGVEGVTATNAAGVLTISNASSFKAMDIAVSSAVGASMAVTSVNGETPATTTAGRVEQRAETIDFSVSAAPVAGDSFTVGIGTQSYSYVSGKGETMEDVARGLKTAIDSAAVTGVKTNVTKDGTTGAWSLAIDDATGGRALALTVTQGGEASGGLFGLDSINVTNNDGARAALSNIETMISKSIDAAASFGSAQKRIDIQSDFVGKLSDALKSGIGSMVDADMEETSARLQALQVQQQLGVQALSIANQSPQSILSLFR